MSVLLKHWISGGSYWTPQSSKVLADFIIEVGTYTTGDHIQSITTGAGVNDYLTVIDATPGAETFQAPDISTFQNAEYNTDSLWYKLDKTRRTVTTAELIGYDFARTLVKYDDTTPYQIREIFILKPVSVLSIGDINAASEYCHLSIYWSGVPNLNGYLKGNRGLVRIIFPYEDSVPYIPVNLTAAWVNDYAKIDFVTTNFGRCRHEIWEGIGAGDYILATTLAVGIVTYNNYTWQGVSMNFKIRAVNDTYNGDFTSVVNIAQTPIVIKTNQTTAHQVAIKIETEANKHIVLDWGDGITTTEGTRTHNYATRVNPFFIKVSGDINNINSFVAYIQTWLYGDLTKWRFNLNVSGFGENYQWYFNNCAYSGDLSNCSLPSDYLAFGFNPGIIVPSRGNLLRTGTLFNFESCGLSTAVIDAWLAYAHAYFDANTPIRTTTVTFKFSGASNGIPTDGDNNADRLAIIAAWAAAGKTCVITVRTS